MLIFDPRVLLVVGAAIRLGRAIPRIRIILVSLLTTTNILKPIILTIFNTHAVATSASASPIRAGDCG